MCLRLFSKIVYVYDMGVSAMSVQNVLDKPFSKDTLESMMYHDLIVQHSRAIFLAPLTAER